MILKVKVIVIITKMINIKVKYRGGYRTPATTNNGVPLEITEWPKAFK